MSPGFPRAALATPENDCPECSDSMLPGEIFVFDLHHLGEFRPCPTCNPEGRDVFAAKLRGAMERIVEGGR